MAVEEATLQLHPTIGWVCEIACLAVWISKKHLRHHVNHFALQQTVKIMVLYIVGEALNQVSNTLENQVKHTMNGVQIM